MKVYPINMEIIGAVAGYGARLLLTFVKHKTKLDL